MILLLIVLLASAAETEVVKSFKVISNIYVRFATTTLMNTVENDGDESEEITFKTVIPERAFVSNFTITIDGRTTVGRVLEKSQANRVFEAAETTSVLISEREKLTSRTFEVKVRVPGGQKTRLELTYQELLERKASYYRHFIHVPETSEDFRSVTVDVIISDRNNIKNIVVPWISPKLHQKTTAELLKLPKNTNVKLEHHSSVAYLFYSRENDNGGDMIVMYDVVQTKPGGDIFVMNGYFLHFITADSNPKRAMDQNVVFVLDKSFSMRSPINDNNDVSKFDQIKLGVKEMLNELGNSDKLSVVMFSSTSYVWKRKLAAATKSNKDDIISNYFKKARAGEATNIEMGLKEGFKIIDKESSPPPLCSVLFLTDGKATVGERDDEKLLRAVRKANKRNCQLHTIAFGSAKEINYNLLKRLAQQNSGVFRAIFTDSDADVQLKGFFNEIAHVFLKQLRIKYVRGSVKPSSLIDTTRTLVQGGETVLAGATKSRPIKATVRGKNKNRKRVKLKAAVHSGAIPCKMPLIGMSDEVREIASGIICDPTDTVSANEHIPKSPSSVEGIIERAFAFQTVTKLLNDFLIKPKARVRKKALRMALKYNFVTELTSMVAVDTPLIEITETINGLPPPPPILMSSFASAPKLENDFKSRAGGGTLPERSCVTEHLNCARHGRAECSEEDSYVGTKNNTVNGFMCQRWDRQYPHPHQNNPAPHNFCRNVGGNEAPWCFTTEPDIHWEYCFPDCFNTLACEDKSGSCGRKSKDLCEPSHEDNYWMRSNCCRKCSSKRNPKRSVRRRDKKQPPGPEVVRPARGGKGCTDKHHLCIHHIGHRRSCNTEMWRKRCPKTCKVC